MVIDRPPYRPFLLLSVVVRVGVLCAVSGFIAFWVFFFASLIAQGQFMGPGEMVKFASHQEVLDEGLTTAGPAWPGSDVRLDKVTSGYVLTRTWLGLNEAEVRVTPRWEIDTTDLAYGSGETVQDALLILLSLACGLMATLGLLRLVSPLIEGRAGRATRQGDTSPTLE